MTRRALRRAAAAGLAALLWAAAALAQPAPLPSFAELEAAGARIGEIRVLPRNIFDTENPKENVALFRWANRVHAVTRPEVVRQALLFQPGEPVSARLIEETERALRALRYFYDVQIRPVAVRDGVVDIEVVTRDTWSLDPGISFGRKGGANDSSVRLREYNLLGTGWSVGVARSSNVDRTATEFGLAGERVLGTPVSIDLAYASADDGRARRATLERPFDELDARRAFGLRVADDDRVDAVYRAGQVDSRFRHRAQRAEVYAGWSPGLAGGWVRRHTVGLQWVDDRYATEPGLAAPPQLPPDQRLVLPYVRYELLEDRYAREINRNLVGRPEYFALGLNLRAQLGLAASALGSSRSALRYAASASRGFEPGGDDTLMTVARLEGEVSDGLPRRQRLGLSAQYYQPQGSHRLFYAAVSTDRLTRPDPTAALLLGGDNGLRGYPLRYQSGSRRVLLTAEQRFYTDLYVWQLFRVGGAVFADAGRAWGGPSAAGGSGARWLADVGAGLRIVSVRTAFGNVLHIDVATPINAPAGVSKVQLLIETRTSF
jgi:hypothetical protein